MLQLHTVHAMCNCLAGGDLKERMICAEAEDNDKKMLKDFNADIAENKHTDMYKYDDLDDEDEKYSDDGDNDDNDDDDNDEDRSRKDSGEELIDFGTHIRKEAAVLIDNVLEESINIISTRQQQQQHQQQEANGYDSLKQEYNSESENYAITCDDIGGLDVIKSPTIESMSGKSFDDNMSFTDEQWLGTQQQTQVSTLPGVVTSTISTINTTQQQKRSHDFVNFKDGFKPITAAETVTTLTTTTSPQIGTTLHEAVTFGGSGGSGGSGGISDVDNVVEEANWKTKGNF